MNLQNDYYIEAIKSELAHRTSRNPKYSLRAFARALGLEATVISQILNKKRTPSFRTAQRIVEGLGLAPDEQQLFYASLAAVQNDRKLERLNPFFRTVVQTQKAPQDLSIDVFRIISDWYHIAILELTFVDGFQSDPAWIAKEIGITELEAKLAIERLLKLNLLTYENKKLAKTNESLSTADKHVTTPALRAHQKQLLEKAMFSLENDPIETRNMSGMAMAIDPKNIPKAKQMLAEYSRNISRFLQTGKRTQVYQLQINLFPIQRTKIPKKKEKAV